MIILKKSLKANYIYNLLYQVLIIILPIITTPYLSRTLGAEGIGIYSYTISIVTYFILFGSVGIAMYGEREIAYTQNNRKERSKIFVELVILRFITLGISALFFYIFFIRNGEYSYYFKILLLELLANCFDISWFYQGLENFKRLIIRNLIVKLISVIAIFCFVKSENDVSIYLWIYVLSTLIGSLSLWISLKGNLEKTARLNLKKHFFPMIVLFIPQIAIQIYTVLDKTMIGFILNDMSEVGYYEQAQKIIKLLLTVVTSLGTVMLPHIAKCFAENKHDEIKKYMLKTFRFIFFLSIPLMLGIIATASNFVPIFFGDGYEKVVYIMIIMSAIIVFISISNVTGTQYLLPTKRQKEFTISVMIGACANFLLNLILIPIRKSYGATIATVIAEMLVAMIQLFYIKKEFDLKSILNDVKNYLIAGIVMFCVCVLVQFFITEHLLALILQVAVGIIVYFLILFILNDSFIMEIIHIKNSKKKRIE